ncbi:hypothetical protein ABPG75_013345 [Micractinium tetrahymenae]
MSSLDGGAAGSQRSGVRPGPRYSMVSDAGSAASVTLESVMSQLNMAGSGPSECRVLMPGLDLEQHGLGELDLGSNGGDLAVVTAPRGINLRVAITQHLSLQQQLEGSASAPRSGVLHAHASVPGTPATLPCGLGSAAGTPLAALNAAVQLGPDGKQQHQQLEQQQQQQQQQQQMGRVQGEQQAADRSIHAAASPAAAAPPEPVEQPEKAADSATWQWLMQSRFASRAADGSRAGQPPPEAQPPAALPPQAPQAPPPGSQGGGGAGHPGSVGGSAAEESAAGGEQARQPPRQQAPPQSQGQPSGLQRPRATTLDQLELLQSAAPAVRLDGTRPWTYDGVGGPAAAAAVAPTSRQQAQELEIEYRWRAATRMWPMLAPFVPRLLRQYLLQSQPATRGDSPVFGGIGKALRCRASAPPQSLSRSMRPAMESFPAAVMIADVSGFTALTEALSGQGSVGVELLTKCMNRYFTQVIDLLLLYGGDVEKFAGDCMIVVFLPTLEEAQGSEDGGLAAATLRAVTCGAELVNGFGAMRMLPNGEVVPIPAAERRGSVQPAAAGGPEQGGQAERLEDGLESVVPRLASRGASAAFLVARSGARVAAMAASSGARVTAKAAGSGLRVTGAAASTGVHAAAAVLGASAGAASIAAMAATPRRLLPRGHRGTKSEMHLWAAAEGGSLEAGAGLEGAASRSSSGLLEGHLLLRTHSSPDASMMPDGAAPLHREGSASSGGGSPRGPARSLLRQSSAMASAVLSRLSRASSPRCTDTRQRSVRTSVDAAAEAVLAGQQGQQAAGEGTGGSGGGADAASAEQQRLQRERRLHEQALAELVVLAGPLGTTRPPELPSAAANAEAAAARLAEQRAIFKHIQRTSAPAAKPAQAAGGGGMFGSDGGTVGAMASPFRGSGGETGALGRGVGRPAAAGAGSRVLRTSTAPPAVSSMLHDLAVEEMERLDEVQEDDAEVDSNSCSLETGAPPAADGSPKESCALGPAHPAPQHTQAQHLPALVSGVAYEGAEASRQAGGASTAAAGCSSLAGLPEEGGGADLPAGQEAAAAAEEPGSGDNGAASLEQGRKRRPSMLQRLLSAAVLPLRGRTVSSGGRNEGSTAECQSRTVSMMSEGTVAPWTASLAELSSGLGLPTSGTSQGLSPPAGSRLFGRRSHHRRASSGSWCLPAAAAQGGAASPAHLPSAMAYEALGLPLPPSPGATARSPSPFSADVANTAALGSGGFEPQGSSPGAPARSSQQQVQEVIQKAELSLKVVVAAGTACAFHVGGSLESSADDSTGVPRWEFFIGDPPQPEEGDPEEGPQPRPPIAQLQAAEQHAISGEAVLSPEVVAMVGASCLLDPLEGGNARLVELLEPYQLLPEVQQEAETSSMERAGKQVKKERAALAQLPEVSQGHALQLLRMHLLENVRVRVEAGHIDYVNELRVGTVLFLGFPSLLEPPQRTGPGASRTGLAAVQACMEVVQKRMRQHDGSFLQFRCDEKGFLAICAFGLPGRSHEDGPARGIQAALAIVEAIKRRGGRACCGVTTGQLFCAMVGSQRRSEYTVFGNAINLSARLMVRARQRGAEVYCDATTQQLAKHKARYQQLEPVRVKGRQAPVDIFEVTSLHAEATGQRFALSPLGPQPLPPVPPAAEAAAAAVGAGLVRRGSGVLPGPGIIRSGSGALAAQPDAVPAAGMQAVAPTLAAQLAGAADTAQQGDAAGGPQNGGLLQMSDRLLSIASTSAAPIQLMTHTPMIGRDGELVAITERCVQLVTQRRGGLVMIEGEAGMGKSRLVEELQHSELGGVYESCNLFLGLARRERKSQALYPWRRVLREMFHHDAQLGQLYCLRGTNPVMVATELALKLQAAVPDYDPWRHLLADALDLPLSELPAALPTAEEHRRHLMEQVGSPAGAAQLAMALWMPDICRAIFFAAGRSEQSRAVKPAAFCTAFCRDSDAEFLSAEDRAKSFAARMKRSASITMGLLGKREDGESRAAALVAARAGTPSPRKLQRLQRQQEAAALRQAEEEAAALQQGAAHSRASSAEELYSGSEAGSFSSSPASSFSGSLPSIPGSPSGAALVSADGQDSLPAAAASGGSSPQGGSWHGGHAQQERHMRLQRSATSRGPGGFALRPSSPGREISTHLRVKKVQELVVAIIQQFTEAYGPLILVLEDLHHFDTASWRLLTSAVADQGLKQSVLFVVTYRPYFGVLSPALRQRGGSYELLFHHVRAAYRAVLDQPTTLHMILQPFTPEQSRQFVSAALGGADVAPDAAALLWERSNGLPSFLEQLVVFLQLFVHSQMQSRAAEEGSNGSSSCELCSCRPRRRNTVEEVQAMAQAGLEFIRSNVSINSIITDRVDRLKPDEQLTLKVASVYRQLLQAIHPQRPSPAALEASLCALEAASFLGRDPQEPTTWRFCQVLARDVVYSLVPQGTCHNWHAAAAAAMETYSADQIHLPASTIAWHWDHSCRGEEGPSYQRSLRAVEWWQRAAVASLDNGAYADGLPLLQRAQDVASALDRYFEQHSRSFTLMLRDQQAAAQPFAGGGQDSLLAGLPTGMTGATLDSVMSTHGTSLPGPGASAEVVAPGIPRLRRAHWERCMAAMCAAVEVSAESLHEGKAHCLLALYLLGVPLPSSEEYQGWLARQGRRWWRPQTGQLRWLPTACLGASSCRSTEDDPLQSRAAELEKGSYLWMARPDPQVGSSSPGAASAHTRGSWGRRRLRGLAAAVGASAGLAMSVSAAASQQDPAGAAIPSTLAGGGGGGDGEEPWQLPDAAGGAENAFTSTAWGVPTPAPAAGAPALAPCAGPGAFGVVGGAPLWGIPSGAPSSSMPPPAAAGAAAVVAASGKAGARQPPGMEAVQEEGCPGYAAGPPAHLLQPSPFEVQQAVATAGAAPAQAPAATAPAGQSGSSRLSGTLGRPPAASVSSHLSQRATQEGSQQRQQQSASSGLQLRPGGTSGSQQYRAWQAAGLAAAAAADSPEQQQEQRGGMPSSAPVSLSVLPAQSAAVDADLLQEAQHAVRAQQQREHLRQQAVAFGLSAADERYSPQAKAEAAIVLDLLCTLLLAVPSRLADYEGTRYVRWACRHLQGGKVGRSSPFWPMYRDCEAALRSLNQRQAGGRGGVAQQRGSPGPRPSASPPQLARRSVPFLPQTLVAIAGGVANAVASAGRAAKQAS